MPPLDRLSPTSARSWQGAAPTFLPRDGLAQRRPTAPHSPAAAPVPTAQRHGLLPGWQKGCLAVQGYYRPSPFSSVRASRPPHHPAGLAERFLLTAHTFGLTVNNKTKSLCTALQTLLHPPRYTAELHRQRVGDLCSTP